MFRIKRYRPLLLALGAVAVSVGGLVAHQRSGRVESLATDGNMALRNDPAGTSTDLDPVARERKSSVGPRLVKPAPLPPQDVPLAPILPQLIRAARAGNGPAMCRLAFELQRCGPGLESARQYKEQSSDQLLYSDREPNEYAIKEYERASAKVAELEPICAGVNQMPDLKPWRLLLDAARAGHAPSMYRFATQPPFDMNRPLDDMQAWAAYRDEAPGLLRRAAEAGDPWAAYSLFWGYSGNAGTFGVVDPDPKLALTYAVALRGLGEAETTKKLSRLEARLRRKLSADDIRDAERAAGLISPKFASLRGLPLDIRTSNLETAEDCESSDPQARARKLSSPVPDSRQ